MKCKIPMSKPMRIGAIALAALVAIFIIGYGVMQLIPPKNEPYRMRVATYNVGDFSGKELTAGSEECNEAYRKLIAEVDADLWAFQEDVLYVDKKNELKPYETLYNAFPYNERRGAGAFNYKSLVSRLEIKNADYTYFEGLHPIGHKMFMHATITVGDKEIGLVNVHLDWKDDSIRYGQIQQVIAYASQFEYIIIFGDFNPDNLEEEVKLFTDKGYTTANAGAFGTISTYVHHGGQAIDNILVSPNIRIENVGHVKADWLNDHIPFWADIVIE